MNRRTYREQVAEHMAAPSGDLADAFKKVFGVELTDRRRPFSPVELEDEDTLRRSRQSMRAAARRTGYVPRADLPREPWMDELAVATGEWDGGES